MPRFNPGDSVYIFTTHDFTRHDLVGKEGIIYKRFGEISDYYWVFIPDMPGCGRGVSDDPMTNICYPVNSRQIELRG